MTIDERLDRLTARHEALAESIELMIRDHRETFARYDAILAQHETRLAQHAALLGRVIALEEKLTEMAQDHERRLSNLEGPA